MAEKIKLDKLILSIIICINATVKFRLFFGDDSKCKYRKSSEVWGVITSCLVRHWWLDRGRLWPPGHLSAAAAQTVRDAAADAAADAADQREDQGGHHCSYDCPEPPDGLTGAFLAHSHHVSALVICGCDAGSAVEFGESLSDGVLGVIKELRGVTLIVISK